MRARLSGRCEFTGLGTVRLRHFSSRKNQKLATFLSFGGLGWKMGTIRKGDKIWHFTRDVDGVIGRNQI